MKKNNKELSVIVPVYNYEKFIKKNIIKLNEKIASFTDNFEILVVNDGSTDQTKKVLNFFKKNKRIKIINKSTNNGKGSAIRFGIKKSVGKIIIYYDCDLPYFNKLEKIYKYLKKNFDFVLISREKDKYLKIKKNNLFFLRRKFSYFFSYVSNLFLLEGFQDTQAGLKGFKKIHKNELSKYKTNRFLFDVEIIRIAVKNKLKIKKVYSNSQIEDYNLNYLHKPKFYLNILIDFLFIILLIFLKKFKFLS